MKNFNFRDTKDWIEHQSGLNFIELLEHFKKIQQIHLQTKSHEKESILFRETPKDLP